MPNSGYIIKLFICLRKWLNCNYYSSIVSILRGNNKFLYHTNLIFKQLYKVRTPIIDRKNYNNGL